MTRLRNEDWSIYCKRIRNEFQEPCGFSNRTFHALFNAEIRSIEELKTYNLSDLKKINGIGKKSIQEIKRALNNSLNELKFVNKNEGFDFDGLCLVKFAVLPFIFSSETPPEDPTTIRIWFHDFVDERINGNPEIRYDISIKNIIQYELSDYLDEKIPKEKVEKWTQLLDSLIGCVKLISERLPK